MTAASPPGRKRQALAEHYFGLIEATFVFSLAIAFYVWQRRDLKKENEKAKAHALQAKPAESPDDPERKATE